jgi:hypothetical protein
VLDWQVVAAIGGAYSGALVALFIYYSERRRKAFEKTIEGLETKISTLETKTATNQATARVDLEGQIKSLALQSAAEHRALATQVAGLAIQIAALPGDMKNEFVRNAELAELIRRYGDTTDSLRAEIGQIYRLLIERNGKQ